MLPAGIEAAKGSSGKFYGLPSNIYTYILYCNKKIFADAGVTIPRPTPSSRPSSSRPATSSATSTAGRRSICSHERASGTTSMAARPVRPNGEVRFNDPVAIKATQDMIDLLPNMPKEVIEIALGHL